MTRTLTLAVAGFLAATAFAAPVSAAEADLTGTASTTSTTQTEGAVGAKRAGRFMDRYLRHANRDEWDWVRDHSTRRMRQSVRVLRINGDHGNYRRYRRCVGYGEESDKRTCTYLLSGEPMGEISVRRRDDGAMRATGHVLYS